MTSDTSPIIEESTRTGSLVESGTETCVADLRLRKAMVQLQHTKQTIELLREEKNKLQVQVRSAIMWQRRSWFKRLFHRWRPPGTPLMRVKFTTRITRSIKKRWNMWMGKPPVDPSVQPLGSHASAKAGWREPRVGWHNREVPESPGDHLRRCQDHKGYFYEERQFDDTGVGKSGVSLMAFFASQVFPVDASAFRGVPGYVDWAEVSSGIPRYVGHLQPRIPLGGSLPDLRVDGAYARQARLAREAGVTGFCVRQFGRLEAGQTQWPSSSPEQLRASSFPFCFWWDHGDLPPDPQQDDSWWFENVMPAMALENYTRWEDLPLFVISVPGICPEASAFVVNLRQWLIANGHGEIVVAGLVKWGQKPSALSGFDYLIHTPPYPTRASWDKEGNRLEMAEIDRGHQLLDPCWKGRVFDFRAWRFLRKSGGKGGDFEQLQAVVPCYDSEVFDEGEGLVSEPVSPDFFGETLELAMESLAQKPSGPKTVFVYGWNLWHEGAAIEPDRAHGHAWLNRTHEAMLSMGSTKRVSRFGWGKVRETMVILHLYFPDLWDYFRDKLQALAGFDHGLLVTIPLGADAALEARIIREYPGALVERIPNLGRDVLPFLHFGRRLAKCGCRYVLKLHSKKSQHRSGGDKWRSELVDPLLSSPEHVEKIIELLRANEQVAVIGAKGHCRSLALSYGFNQVKVEQVQRGLHLPAKLIPGPTHAFFAGTMFWIKLSAIEPLMQACFGPDDFELERPEHRDGTLAHAIERLLGANPMTRGYQLWETDGTRLGQWKP